jgi:hypothetical protein
MEKEKGYKVENDIIIINRDLTELDLFVKGFLEILKKHSDYLIVSGFVSISTGRSRGTEDVDIIFPVMEKDIFKNLYEDLMKNGYWCYQADNSEKAYDYVKNMSSIRFARVDEMYPNIEFIPFNETKRAKLYEFNHPQKIKIDGFEFKIPILEFEILYKEIILAGKKDIDDAKHLRAFFSGILSEKRFKEIEPVIRRELR